MKNLFLLILIVVVLSSCATLPSPQSYVGMIDYTELTQRGLFVTESNSVSFDYEPIGSIYAEETDGWIKKSQVKEESKSKKKDIYSDDYYSSSRLEFGKKEFMPADVNRVLQSVADQLKRVGANGIINMKIDYIKIPLSKELSLNRIIVSGMAIKR